MASEFTNSDFENAEGSGLSPTYFCAQRIVKEALKDFHEVKFDKILKDVTDRIYESIQTEIEGYLWCNAQSNIQGRIEAVVNDIITALIVGDKWVLDKYIFMSKYNREEIMDEIALRIDQGRIKELEGENERLTKEASAG